jgi:hypothetical protein
VLPLLRREKKKEGSKMKKNALVVMMLLAIMLISQTLMAGEKGTWGLGLQNSSPIYGFSVMYNLDNGNSVNGIIAPAGDVGAIAGRYLWRFNEKEYYNFYGYGLAGLFSHKDYKDNSLEKDTQTALGFGLGLSAEAS